MENQPDRRKFLRDSILGAAGILVGSRLANVRAQKLPDGVEKQPEKGIETEKDIKEIINELFTRREIIPNPGKAFSDKVDIWDRRYSGEDTAYDRLYLLYKKRRNLPPTTLREELEEGWNRLLADELKKVCDLKEVYKITKKEGVPFDLVFLALTESHWKTGAKSTVGAGGPWQFMPATARRYGLKVSIDKRQTVDERKDVGKSTEAACKYLKYLYQLSTENSKIPEADRWTWVFWAYNRGEGHIFDFRGKPGESTQAEGDPNKYFDIARNSESANYAPKIFGLARAMEKIAMKKKGPEKPEDPEKIILSEADILSERFNYENFPTTESQVVFLNELIAKYKEEERNGIHTSSYVEGALHILEKELGEVKAQ